MFSHMLSLDWMPFEPVVSAYLDGGSGSMVLQMAVSGLLATVLVYRSAWAKLKSAVTKNRRPK
jgi:hypothetical protein